MNKLCLQMTTEFGAVMQRPDIRNEFDEELLKWSRAVMNYCRKTQAQCAAIMKILDEARCEFLYL